MNDITGNSAVERVLLAEGLLRSVAGTLFVVQALWIDRPLWLFPVAALLLAAVTFPWFPNRVRRRHGLPLRGWTSDLAFEALAYRSLSRNRWVRARVGPLFLTGAVTVLAALVLFTLGEIGWLGLAVGLAIGVGSALVAWIQAQPPDQVPVDGPV